MNGNAVFVIILIVIYLFAVYGKHQGFFRAMIPALSVIFSIVILVLVFPDFSKRFAEDAKSLNANEMIIDVLSFVLAFVIVRFVFKLICKLIGPLFDLPVIKSVDRTLGLFAGFFTGIVIVWLVFFLGLFFLGRDGMQPLFGMMESSALLRFVYNHNLLMTLVNKMIFA